MNICGMKTHLFGLEQQEIHSHVRHRAAIGLAGAMVPPLFSKIVLKAITNMAFSTEIFSAPNCCI